MAPARTLLDDLRDLAERIREAGGAEVHMRDAELIRRAIAVQEAMAAALKGVVAVADRETNEFIRARAIIAKAEDK